MSDKRVISRRTLLASGLALAASGVGLRSDADTIAPPRVVANLANQPNVLIERVRSEARNRDVNIVTMFPEGVPRRGIPVCLMLHGRFGDARKSAADLPVWLTQAVASGAIPPFAFLAVDGGGNSYWHKHEGDDPMWMLLDEVPRWIAERGLGGDDGHPFAVSGISMGGFGALVYARRRHERKIPLRAAGVVSPALITNWPEMRKRMAFTNEQQWASLDPLRHASRLGGVPLGVWCGTGDRFITGTRQFINKVHPEYASTTPGGHNSRYYREALPELIRFIGSHVRRSGGSAKPTVVHHTARSGLGE